MSAEYAGMMFDAMSPSRDERNEPVIARLTVQRGDLTEYPLAERTRGGWQNGVTFYPDDEVVKVVEGWGYTKALNALLDWLPSHITHVAVEEVRAALAGEQRWINLLEARGKAAQDDE